MNFVDLIIYSKRWPIRIFRHAAFWATDVTCYLLIISANSELQPWVLKSLMFVMPLAILATYFIIYYIIPTYTSDHSRIKVIFLCLTVFLFIGVGMRYYRFFIVYPIIDPTHAMPANLWGIGGILSEVFSWMGVMSSAIAIKMAKNKTELQQKNESLLEEKKMAELNFLKAQMNPHFLFNTLNTLYSDAVTGGDKSEEIVLRLSSLLRFMLEECNQRVIPIEKEMKVIEDYIQLEKLRHGNRLQVDYQSHTNGSPVFISPLLMLPFVENSCKHTLLSKRGDIKITVRISTTNNAANLFVENELSADKNGSSPGIGIANVRRQLELLYGRDFKLEIRQDQGKHIVNLDIPTLKEQ